MVRKLNQLSDIAAARGQKLSQMAIAWLLSHEAVATVLTGASRPEQIVENVKALDHLDFTDNEVTEIRRTLRIRMGDPSLKTLTQEFAFCSGMQEIAGRGYIG